jgi:hypothetical protein
MVTFTAQNLACAAITRTALVSSVGQNCPAPFSSREA